MKHKNLTLMAVAMSIVLSLSACGGAENANSVASTESVATESTESVENSTEAFVPEEELSTKESVETTEATESVAETVTETQEPAADEAVIDAKTVSGDKTAGAGYTYSDLSKTMYAKSTVNVRSLPSTSGNRLGSLSKNQEVTVTGQCNETGWYRISYNNAEGFVSNKYLADEPVAAAASTKTAQAGTQTQTQTGTKNSGTSTGDPVIDAAIAKYGPNIMVANDGTIYSTETWQQVGTVDSTGAVSDYTKPAEPVKPADGFDKGMAQQIWAYVNEERAAAGLNALAWDEDIYNFACQRAQAIVTNYSHDGCGYYAENIYGSIPSTWTAYDTHTGWHNSKGHYNNYMNSEFATGACAVYMCNGYYYAVENFTRASNAKEAEYYGLNTTREYNGKTLDLSGRQAEAFDNGNFWVASNGIIVYVESSGNLSCNATGDAAMAALNEYDATH